MRASRLGEVSFAVLFGFAMWSWGPTPRALAGPAVPHEIIDLLPGAYQVTYFDVSSHFTPSNQGWGGPGSSGGTGDALVHIIDVGNFREAVVASPVVAAPDSVAPIGEAGSLCANIYVFDDDQELQECCSCPLTADSLQTFSVITNLTSNPKFPSPLGVGVIKIVASVPFRSAFIIDAAPQAAAPFGCVSGGNGALGMAGTLTPDDLANGLTAWINHAESVASNNPGFTPPFGFVTSTSVDHFATAELDSGELNGPNGLATLCQNIELHASGRGICSCGIGS